MRDEWKGSRRNGQLAHQSNLLLTALRGRGDFCKETKNWLSKQSIFTMYLSPIRRRVLRFIHEDEIINLAKLGTMVQDPPAAAKSLMSKVRPTARFLGKIYELNEKWHSSLC